MLRGGTTSIILVSRRRARTRYLCSLARTPVAHCISSVQDSESVQDDPTALSDASRLRAHACMPCPEALSLPFALPLSLPLSLPLALPPERRTRGSPRGPVLTSTAACSVAARAPDRGVCCLHHPTAACSERRLHALLPGLTAACSRPSPPAPAHQRRPLCCRCSHPTLECSASLSAEVSRGTPAVAPC